MNKIVIFNQKLELFFNLRTYKKSNTVLPIKIENIMDQKIFFEETFFISSFLNERTYLNKYFKFKNIFDYYNSKYEEKIEEITKKAFSFLHDNLIFNEIDLLDCGRTIILDKIQQIIMNYYNLNEFFNTEKPKYVEIYPSVDKYNRLLIYSICKLKRIPFKLKKSINLFAIKKFLILFDRFASKVITKFIYSRIPKKINFVNLKPKNPYFKRDNEKKQILTLLFTKNHLVSYLSIFKKFMDEAKFQNYFLFLSKTYYSALFSKPFLIQIKKFKQEINFVFPQNQKFKFNHFPYKLNENCPFFNLNNINFFNIFKLLTKDLHNFFGELIYIYFSFKDILVHIKPNLIIILNEVNPPGRILTHISKIFKIPSVYIPHAQIGKHLYYSKIITDYAICAGIRDLNYYNILGTEKSKLILAGHPRYDTILKRLDFYLSQSDEIITKVYEDFKLDKKNKLILLGTSPFSKFIRKKMFISTIDAIERIPNFQLIHKLHPRESFDFYNRLLKEKTSKNVRLIRDYDLYKLILASNLIIARSSGLEFEAMLLDKNIIDFQLNTKMDRYFYIKYNSVFPVYKEKNLSKAIIDVLYDESIQKELKKGRLNYIKDSIYKTDGKSSNRICDVIKKILKVNHS